MMQVKILELTPDWRSIKLLLPLSEAATNHQGTMFGGVSWHPLPIPLQHFRAGSYFLDTQRGRVN